MSKDISKVKSHLMRMCSMREYCSRDIYEKALKSLENDTVEAGTIVRELIDEGYISDSRYAAAFARDKSSIKGWGPVKIQYQLRSKGISSEIIKEAMAQIDSQKADDKLRKSVEVKCKSLAGDPQIKIKLFKFALSRGYDYETAHKVVSEILHGKK